MSEPAYAFIEALSKYINNPSDRVWKELFLEVNNKPFVKYVCHKKEIILKPYSHDVNNKIFMYYIGQCPRCEKIYYVQS